MEELPEIVAVDEETNQQLLEDYGGEKTGWHLVGPEKYLYPSRYSEEVSKFLNIKTRPDDIWLSTFPRSGTTLSQELIWMVMNDCDYDGAKKALWERTPFLELCILFHPETKQIFMQENEDNPENQEHIMNMSVPVYEYIDQMESPRVIKTHFPPSLLPYDIEETQAKVIYVARNPKDIVISYYHLLKQWRTSGYLNSFEHFTNQFIDGLVPWAPFWLHVQEGWDRRNQDNYLFLFYEDIVKDMKGAIEKVANYVNKPMEESQIEELANHLDISNFKNNTAVNFEILRDVGIYSGTNESFIRQGAQRGSTEYTDEIKDRMNDWIEAHYELTDLRFPTN